MPDYFICDLSHTSQRISSEYIPYAIGCIKSYYHAHGKHDGDIHLIKYPEDLSPKFLKYKPSIVSFSNYMWNTDLSYNFAKAIKEHSPQTLIVFGGRNYPLETARQIQWFEEHPFVDLYIIGEGEEPWMRVVDLWAETQSIEDIKLAEINGVHSLINGVLHKPGKVRKDGYDEEPRIKNLEDIPSPYLMGYLDDFLVDELLSPLIETNRGCPFQCTFCVDGVGSRNKVYKGNPERSEEELVYIAQRHKGKYLQLADVNFGMYEEDIAFSKSIARVKEEYDFPHHIQVCAGKNRQERIIECGDILEGSLRFGASIQSMDPEVLKNIKRSNISYETLMDVSRRVSNTPASTYSELILALPGDSKEKHLKSFRGVISAGINQVRPLTLILLEGSELATDAQRKQFDMKSRFRATHRSFGIYEFNGKKFPSVEVEEVCVENDALSFEDYVECRRFALSTSLFYNDKAFFELTQFIKNMGFSVFDWLNGLHEQIDKFPKELRNIYDHFVSETIEELADSREDLIDWIKNTPGVMESYIKGERGNNVLFNTQAKAQIGALDEIHAVVFDFSEKFTRVIEDDESSLYRKYLKELRRYSLAKRRAFHRVDESFTEDFLFDFVTAEKEYFETLPQETCPCKIRFYYEDWQKEFFIDNVQRQGSSIQAMGKIFSRVPIKKFQRSVSKESEM